MKFSQLKKILFALLLLTPNLCLKAKIISPKVVYGEDDRLDYFELIKSGNQVLLNLAQSVAVQVSKKDVVRSGTKLRVRGQEFGQTHRLCDGSKFARQPVPGLCTGFLVGPDVIVTAGHCIEDEYECHKNMWLFSYYLQDKSDKGQTIRKQNLFSCKKILKQYYNPRFSDMDFAILQLDRKAENREVLRVRSEGKIDLGREVFVMGHPDGLPQKFAGNAFVKRNDNVDYFSANLDTFRGNSGSPVFNADTLEVEGILVRGNKDYIKVKDEQGKYCYKVNYLPNDCKGDECSQEEVTRITQIGLGKYI